MEQYRNYHCLSNCAHPSGRCWHAPSTVPRKQTSCLRTTRRTSSAPPLRAIARGAYRDKTADDVSGSGYVVDCLEAALWCFVTTDSFSAAILHAANLGHDADTTAAVCGQIAGAYYGEIRQFPRTGSSG